MLADAMDERKACQQLKQRFEAAGFRIAEGVDFDGHGLRFELDGFDAAAGVGYEYHSREAGDGWDVDDAVIAKLTELHQAGEVHILVVSEDAAPDESRLDAVIEPFLAAVKQAGKSGGARAKAPSQPPPVPKAGKGKKTKSKR